MIRPVPRILAAALVLLGAGAAEAADHTFTVTTDNYVKRTNKGPYDREIHLSVKNKGGKDNTRKGLLHFDMPVTPHIPYEAALSLDVISYSDSSAAVVYVFGINGPAQTNEACRALASGVDGYKYKSDPVRLFLEDSGNGVIDSSPCIYGNKALGTFQVKSSDVNKTISFTSPELLEYLADVAGTDGRAVFVLTRGDRGDKEVHFASLEHPTKQAARLSFSNADNFVFEGSTPPAKNYSGPQSWTGTLKIPIGGGDFITLPQASVTITYLNGRILSLNGLVNAAPQLPDSGLLSAIEITETGLQFGWDKPDTFGLSKDGIPSPLRSSRNYFFLRALVGGLEAGPLEFAPPGAGETILAFDPSTSTMYGYTNQIPIRWPPIEDAAIGLSTRKGLSFTPFQNTHAEEYIQPFDANFYGALTLGINSEKWVRGPVEFGLSIYGGMYSDAKAEAFRAGDEMWMRKLGINGKGTLNVALGPLGFDFDFAKASSVFYTGGLNGGGNPALAIAGRAKTPKSLGMALPFGFKGDVDSAMVLDLNSADDSYILIDGEVGLPGINASLHGHSKLGPAGGEFSGTATFPRATVGMGGDIDFSSGTMVLTGSTTLNATKDGWGFKLAFKPKLKFSSSGVSLDMRSSSAKACGNLGITEGCLDAKDIQDIDVRPDKIKVCMKFPSPIGSHCIDNWK